MNELETLREQMRQIKALIEYLKQQKGESA